MIRGFVEPDLAAVVPLRVRGLSGGVRESEAVVDTGFDGWLSLPPFLVRELGLKWLRAGRARLADGTEVDVQVYEAQVEWNGLWRDIPVDEADTDPLIGMRLLRRSRLTLDVTEGGAVTIVPLPPNPRP